MKELSDLKNVGKATLGDLHLLGIYTIEELAKQDATELYRRLQKETESAQNPCVWDVFAAIIDEAKGGPPTPWWHWSPERKKRGIT